MPSQSYGKMATIMASTTGTICAPCARAQSMKQNAAAPTDRDIDPEQGLMHHLGLGSSPQRSQ